MRFSFENKLSHKLIIHISIHGVEVNIPIRIFVKFQPNLEKKFVIDF